MNLIEVFCRKKHLYLVFEFVDHTVLDDLDQRPSGLDEDAVRRILWQVLKAIHFCHVHNVSCYYCGCSSSSCCCCCRRRGRSIVVVAETGACRENTAALQVLKALHICYVHSVSCCCCSCCRSRCRSRNSCSSVGDSQAWMKTWSDEYCDKF